MSIQADLAGMEQDGKLLRYEPGRRASRRLYLTAHAVGQYNDPESSVNILVGRGYIRAAFERWTTGGYVHGDRGVGVFLKPLHPPPPDIWEVRVTDPVPQARIFGRFLESDTLVVTHLHTRRHLDEDNGWMTAMNACNTAWEALFPFRRPFTGEHIHEYVTRNCDDFSVISRPPGRRGRK